MPIRFQPAFNPLSTRFQPAFNPRSTCVHPTPDSSLICAPYYLPRVPLVCQQTALRLLSNRFRTAFEVLRSDPIYWDCNGRRSWCIKWMAGVWFGYIRRKVDGVSWAVSFDWFQPGQRFNWRHPSRAHFLTGMNNGPAHSERIRSIASWSVSNGLIIECEIVGIRIGRRCSPSYFDRVWFDSIRTDEIQGGINGIRMKTISLNLMDCNWIEIDLIQRNPLQPDLILVRWSEVSFYDISLHLINGTELGLIRNRCHGIQLVSNSSIGNEFYPSCYRLFASEFDRFELGDQLWFHSFNETGS